jgi:hypothetical protein
VVGITNDTFSSKKRADGTYITGLGNTTTSLKYEAVPNLLSFSYTVTFPTASVEKTLGSGRLDHKIMGDLSKTVKDTTLGLSLGYLFTGIKGESGFLKTGLAALLVSQPLDDKFTYKGEIDLASRAKNTASEIFAINQVVYKINDTFSIRAGARTGITANSPRIGFTAGLSINTLLK